VYAIAAAALLASGCAHHPPPAPAPAPAAIDLPPLPRPKPETHAHPAPPPAPSPDIVLVGLNRADIEAALGEPSTLVEQGASQSWSYRGTRCKVELTLFFDVSRNDFYALDRRIDGTDGTEKAAQRCLKQIRDAHAAKPPEAGKTPDPVKATEPAK
jgi:hypothetical protein